MIDIIDCTGKDISERGELILAAILHEEEGVIGVISDSKAVYIECAKVAKNVDRRNRKRERER